MDTRIIELLEACYDEELSLMSGDLGKSTYNHDVHPAMRSLQGVFPFAGWRGIWYDGDGLLGAYGSVTGS